MIRKTVRGFRKMMLLAGWLCLLLGGMASAAPQDTMGDPLRAQEELAREARRISEQAARKNDDTFKSERLFVAVTDVEVRGNKRMTEDEILALVPELKRTIVGVRRLSQQLQLVNDSGGLKLGAQFAPDGECYKVTVSVEEKKSEHVLISVGNTGNAYTGDWRLTTGYIGTNATHRADTVGAAVVTSPGHWGDVKQAALSYKMLFPKEMGSLVFTASWSDVDLGNLAVLPGYDYNAGGRGVSVGLHGQKYISYTSRNKDFWDFGVDHRAYENENRIPGFGWANDYNYSVTMLSAAYIHSDRSERHAFAYDLGLAGNITGDKDKFDQATYGSDKNFLLWKGGASYQYRTKNDWIFGLRLRGQYTNHNVVSCEQIGAGGLYTVRGFNERTISADTGLIGSFEIFTPEWLKNSRFCIFTDYGTLHNNNDNSVFRSETLGSAGIGYRYTDEKNGISLRVDYAKIIDDIRQDLLGRQGHKQWNVLLTVSF